MRTRRLSLPAVLLTVATLLLGLVGLAPAQATPAQVTGTVQITGEDLLTDTTWDSEVTTTPAGATRAYQWLRDGQPIVGENDVYYDTTSADVGHHLSLRVVVSAPGYADGVLTSASYGPIAEDDSDEDELWTFDAYRPVIVGKPRVGQTVKVTTDEDDYDEDTTLVYQWLLGGQPAKKGTGTTFKIKKKFRGKVLTVQVTASEEDYETETVTSRPVKIKR